MMNSAGNAAQNVKESCQEVRSYLFEQNLAMLCWLRFHRTIIKLKIMENFADWWKLFCCCRLASKCSKRHKGLLMLPRMQLGLTNESSWLDIPQSGYLCLSIFGFWALFMHWYAFAFGIFSLFIRRINVTGCVPATWGPCLLLVVYVIENLFSHYQ